MFYLFHHIPKTAGTSVRMAFAKLFTVHEDYHRDTSREERARYAADKVDLSALTERDILCGHWNINGSRLWEKYPELDTLDVRKIVFLRPPLETAISGVRYNIANGQITPAQADEMLLKRAKYFAGGLRCNAANYRERIDSYWHVGLASRVQASLDIIADAIGAARALVPRINVTEPVPVHFSAAAIAAFKEQAQLDQQIFDYAQTIANAAYDRTRGTAPQAG